MLGIPLLQSWTLIIKGRFHDMFLRANFARVIFARRNISARVHSTTKSVFCISILFWFWKMQKLATSAVFCKNAWIWLVSLFYFASELKKVQLTGAENFFWLQRLIFQCACPELIPLANFALCAEKSGRGICPLHKCEMWPKKYFSANVRRVHIFGLLDLTGTINDFFRVRTGYPVPIGTLTCFKPMTIWPKILKS